MASSQRAGLPASRSTLSARWLPATFVIDASGTVRWKGDRAHGAEELRAVVDSVR